ncbi:hypothetical protein [Geodermatophilus ruber]|uniref:Uncharacterized protein n=1 Tax=Geodermatophilus ruber TaxID=504800 RepID=A0A1I4FJZ1_9ACTN|nr:hypothetical protein [Geodermatophilus ruber]SFL18265.1 hypothetical protein SAMN04488085_107213 [Geodermatophilus ruber]
MPPSDPRMPGLALAAGLVGFLGALPPALLAVVAIALGGLSGDAGPDPWTYLLVAAAVLQVAAAAWLVARRAWWPLVLAVLPLAVFTGAVIAAGQGDGGRAWPLLLLVLPVIAAGLALTPPVRRWVTGRPRPARGERRTR